VQVVPDSVCAAFPCQGQRSYRYHNKLFLLLGTNIGKWIKITTADLPRKNKRKTVLRAAHTRGVRVQTHANKSTPGVLYVRQIPVLGADATPESLRSLKHAPTQPLFRHVGKQEPAKDCMGLIELERWLQVFEAWEITLHSGARDSSFSFHDRLLWIELALTSQSGVTTLSIPHLSRRSRMSPSSVKRSLQKLESLDVISRERISHTQISVRLLVSPLESTGPLKSKSKPPPAQKHASDPSTWEDVDGRLLDCCVSTVRRICHPCGVQHISRKESGHPGFLLSR
jgi:hypothetical protein